MRISVFGLGYVGTISAGCLAKEGHQVIGVDVHPTKVDMINAGQTPIIEAEIGEIIADVVAQGRLTATTSSGKAVKESDVSLVCVGTPSMENGDLNLDFVKRVSKEIGSNLRSKDGYHVVVMRSTMLPGSMHEVVIPTLEQNAEKEAGRDFGVYINPEFLREGTAVYDFYHPPKTVIGVDDEMVSDLIQVLYANLPGPKIQTDIRTAEMVKYADNVWHAVKICFANEIGNICKELEIDSHDVMDIFCKDHKLNISPYYLKPGFAFGGSCLPKDVRALTYKGKTLDLELPILNAILSSNRYQVQRGLQRIMGYGKKRIGILGFSFKAGTDDLRESPVVDVIETLLGKGYAIKIYDHSVNLALLVGANRKFIEERIPHIAKLMTESLEEVLEHGDVLVVGNKSEEFKIIEQTVRPGQIVIDLVRLWENPQGFAEYEGICW
ncbi:MAG: nucleotide sugar dehydrogenase [Bacteroidota bacterium]|nr:nucleotide sugar dehydrogenase [Bacteroidota bacterium]